MKQRQNSFALVFMFVTAVLGAMMGAGFASGKEIQTFFTNYGALAYTLMIIAFLIFAWAFYIFARIGKIVKPHSISDITRASLGKASYGVDILLVLSMFVTFSAMLSAADSFAQTIDPNYTFPWASVVMAILVVITLSGGKQSMFNASLVVMPMVVIMLFSVLISFFIGAPKENASIEWLQSTGMQAKGILFAFLYAGLNTISESFIVARVSEKMNKKQAIVASVSCSLIILLFVFMISTALINAGDYVYNSSLPMLKLAYLTNTGLGNSYGLVLLMAIFTTSVSTTYTMTSWLKQFVKNKFLSTNIIVVIGFILSRFGFSNIVENLYPLKGVLGVALIVSFSWFYLSHGKNKKLDYQYTSKLYY